MHGKFHSRGLRSWRFKTKAVHIFGYLAIFYGKRGAVKCLSRTNVQVPYAYTALPYPVTMYARGDVNAATQTVSSAWERNDVNIGNSSALFITFVVAKSTARSLKYIFVPSPVRIVNRFSLCEHTSGHKRDGNKRL